MKKNLTKKLMLSVLTLAFAVVSLGASTFAWFTVAETATVDKFNAQVVSGAGIEIAVGGIDSKLTVNADGTISTNGIVSQFYIGKVPTSAVEAAIKGTESALPELNNVSSASNKADATAAAKFEGVLYDEKGDTTSKNYYAFKFYVRSEQTGKIVLNNFALSETTTNTKTPWSAGLAYKDGHQNPIGANDKVAYSLLSAARLGIITEADNKVYQAAEDSTKARGSNTAGFKGNDCGALYVYNQKYINETAKQIPALTVDQTPAWEKTSTAWDGEQLILSVVEDTVYEVKVYVWIEGYDAECYNAIFSQYLQGQFNFAWHECDFTTNPEITSCPVCGANKPNN